MGSEEILAGIEVRVTHEVNFEKSESLPIPFIEIDGYEFVENPNEINVLLDKFNPITCTECKEKLRNYISSAKELAKQSNIDLPTSFYRFGISNCWKCKKTNSCFYLARSSLLFNYRAYERTKTTNNSVEIFKYNKI